MSDKPDSDPLLELAAAVAAGSDVNWSTAESTVKSELRRIIGELRVVAQVASVYGDAPRERPADVSAPVPAAPWKWGPLEVRREIGQGRFGTVYLAWDPGLQREVALKLLRDANRAASAIQEGRMLASVRHPNVVTIHGVDEYDGTVGLWMERVEGLTLTQVVTARGVLGAHEAAIIGIDLCRAVAAVHKEGLLHRDIKAHNVMREAGGRIVLMDFGAGEIRAERPHELYGLAGTPLYLAPEVLAGQPATIASDIYSLGVLLYHLVTLGYPIAGSTMEQVESAHLAGRRVLLGDARPDLLSGFVRVVDRALDPDPARRYRSAGAMWQDLRATLDADAALVAPSPASGAGDRAVTPSVAVLPFDYLGPDPDFDYFCSGLAEELLTGLGKVPGLRVASRTSSFGIKATVTDIRSICKQLKVDAVLEGSVRKAGDRLRVTAQLVSADDGCHLWSEGYERQIADVFDVQNEIAQSVVDRLKVTLAEVPRRPLIRRHTDSPRAYQLYLKGRFYWTRRYQDGLKTALDCFKQAIEEDAGYAQAHTGIADAHVFMGIYSVQKPRVTFALAAEAAARALAIDPDLSEAHTSLGLVRFGDDWNWQEADREFARALELDPNQALPLVYRSWIKAMEGDAPGAIAEARRAQELEPMSQPVNVGAAYTLFLAGRDEDAIAECQKCLELQPDFLVAVNIMGQVRARQGRLADAITLMERAVSTSNAAPFYLGLLGNFCARAGRSDRVKEIVAALDRLAPYRYVPPHCMAYIYAGQGDLDRAFEWEAKAYDDGAPPFNYYSPLIEHLRGDPRHVAEIRRMKGLR